MCFDFTGVGLVIILWCYSMHLKPEVKKAGSASDSTSVSCKNSNSTKELVCISTSFKLEEFEWRGNGSNDYFLYNKIQIIHINLDSLGWGQYTNFLTR